MKRRFRDAGTPASNTPTIRVPAWYATTFVLPQKPAEYDILLDFEAVYADADVWLNGEHLGSHDFGFTSFGFDITGRIAPGAVNRLVIRAENSFKLGATWNWGGIRRPVTLRTVPRERIESVFVSAEPDLQKGSAEIGVKVLLNGTKQGVVRVSISDPEGRIVARGEAVPPDAVRRSFRSASARPGFGTSTTRISTPSQLPTAMESPSPSVSASAKSRSTATACCSTARACG